MPLPSTVASGTPGSPGVDAGTGVAADRRGTAAHGAAPRGLVTPTVLGLLALGAGVCWALGAAGLVVEPWFRRARTTYAQLGQSRLEPSLGQVHGRRVSAVGKHVYQPRSLAELASEYALGAGELTLDLTQLDFSSTTREVQLQVGTGKATVIVPPDTRVEAHGRAGLGDTTLLDRRQGGFGSNVEASSAGNGAGTLLIDVGVGIGEGTVRRGL